MACHELARLSLHPAVGGYIKGSHRGDHKAQATFPPPHRCFPPALSSSPYTTPSLSPFHIGSNHEGLGILSRRPRALLFHHNPLIGPIPGSSSIVNPEHDVLERLDDGRELHEVGVHSLSTFHFRPDHFEQCVERFTPQPSSPATSASPSAYPGLASHTFSGVFVPSTIRPVPQPHNANLFVPSLPIRFSLFLRFVSLL